VGNEPPLFVDWGSAPYHRGSACAFSKYVFQCYKLILLGNGLCLYFELLHFNIFFLIFCRQLQESNMFLFSLMLPV
jgi:hypothetical protein